MIVFALARSTFNEAIRRRILMVLLFFALAMIVASFAFSSFMSTENKLVTDMGLSAIQLFGVVISIVIAIVMIPAEVDRRTIYTILSKPVSRRLYVLGKFLGAVYTIGFNTLIMSVVFLLAIYLKTHAVQWLMVESIWLWLLEFILLAAIAVLFSILVSPMVNGFICIGVLILGNLASYVGYLKTFQAGNGLQVALTKDVLKWIYNLVPNFQNFDIGQKISQGQSVDAHYIGVVTIWTMLYVAFLLLMSMQFFSSKEV
jgi:ABC-type transport system involved in multi-copper enzyme maturation permease subunit